jgi:hypothetical protein
MSMPNVEPAGIAWSLVMAWLWLHFLTGIFDVMRQSHPAGSMKRIAFKRIGMFAIVVLVAAALLWSGIQLSKEEIWRIGVPELDEQKPLNRDRLMKDLAPDAVAKISRTHARWTYVTKGQLTETFDTRDGWIAFRPSQDEARVRDAAVEAQSGMQCSALARIAAAFLALASATFTGYLGWREGRRK